MHRSLIHVPGRLVRAVLAGGILAGGWFIADLVLTAEPAAAVDLIPGAKDAVIAPNACVTTTILSPVREAAQPVVDTVASPVLEGTIDVLAPVITPVVVGLVPIVDTVAPAVPTAALGA